MKSHCNHDYDVLVVGAGPAGLTIANLLARTSLKFTIIEKETSGQRPSRATGLQPRLLEIFEYIGIKDQVIKRAITLKGSQIFVDGNQTATVSFYDPVTNSHSLSLDQGVIEAMLAATFQKGGGVIEWGKRLVGLRRKNDRWMADIATTIPSLEYITADIIIACDGGKSTVRKFANIEFVGETYSETSFISDCRISSDLKPQYVCFLFSKEYRLVLVPFSQSKYKVSGGMHLHNSVAKRRLCNWA